MKNRVLFLIKIISVLYPKLDFFELLKEICINDPVFETDKLIFYDFMKKYISENNSIGESNESKEHKIAIQTQLFNMLTKENKTEMTSTQFNLYLEIFLNINRAKELLIYDKNANDEYAITINNNVSIDTIYGIDELWELLFNLNKEYLSQKLINIIFSLYKNKEEIQKLLDKCVNIIEDIENITYNKLEKCINILKFIILESEKKGFIEIKSHFGLLKDCIINIPLEFKKNRKTDIYTTFTLTESNRKNNKEKELLFGNMTLMELKHVLIEKHNLDKNNMTISLSSKENNNTKTKELDQSYNNKSIKEILNIENNDFNYEQIEKQKNNINSCKIIYTGEKIEKQSLIGINGNGNLKFKNMIKEWFNFYSKGNDIMDKDNIISFISAITSNDHIDENSQEYIEFMKKCDEDEKNFILEDEFVKYYNKMAKSDEEKVWKHIRALNYREDFKKNTQPANNTDVVVNNKKLPRYILGNDKQFHDALIQLFMKFDKKMPIYQFLFFLCTNENEYDELMNNFNILFNDDINNNYNYLDMLYKLYIIESFIQDLEVDELDVNQIFKNKSNQTNSFKKQNIENVLLTKDNMPFDDKKYLVKKKSFLINFILNGGYEKLIKYIEVLLDNINNIIDDEQIEIKCCKKGLKIINIIYD